MCFYKKLSISLLLTLVASCGSGGSSSSVQSSSSQTQMDAQIDYPKEILYVQGDNTSTVYTAKGNGGIGSRSAFTSSDSLDLYQGMAVTTSGIDANSKITANIAATDDSASICKNMFVFDSSSHKINVDGSKVTSLTICHEKVTITIDDGGTLLTSKPISFDVTINPTLKYYFSKQDKLANYWLSQFPAGQDEKDTMDISGYVGWIAKNSELNLSTDSSKPAIILDDVNAITGAQNIISLDLSNTQVKDIHGLLYLKNLQTLNLSNTRVTQSDLATLAVLPNLKSLTVQGLNLTDLSYITNNLPNLTYLDISNNEKLFDLSPIKNLINLTTLVASHIGLINDINLKSDFKILSNLTQITSLNISDNSLSYLDKEDAKNLASLFQLTSLDISRTGISDDFLNTYFSSIYYNDHPILKKFIDRNNFDLKTPGKCSFNRFSDNGTGVSASNIQLLRTLEYLDLHGNSCLLSDSKTIEGITNLNFLLSLKNLKYLDISDNAILDVSLLNNLNIPNPRENLIMAILGDNSRKLTSDLCKQQLLAATGSSSYVDNCSVLPEPGIDGFEEYTSDLNTTPIYKPCSDFSCIVKSEVDHYEGTFTVPDGVTTIHLSGCSAGDGGQGGQGGATGIDKNSQSLCSDRGYPGWNCNCWGRGKDRECSGGSYFNGHSPSSTPSIVAFGSGSTSGFGDIFKTDQEIGSGVTITINKKNYTYCSGGAAGKNGTNSDGSAVSFQTASGASKKLTSPVYNDISVYPGQSFVVKIGKGSAGTPGTMALPNTSKCDPSNYTYTCAPPPQKGSDGGNGSSGYIKVSYKHG